MARSDLHHLKGSLSAALKKVAQAGPGSALGPVWAEAAGPLLAGASRPMRLHDGLLTVEVEPTALRELEPELELIRRRLNSRLGRDVVRSIHVVSSHP